MAGGARCAQGHDFGVGVAGALGVARSDEVASRIHQNATHTRIGISNADSSSRQAACPLLNIKQRP